MTESVNMEEPPLRDVMNDRNNSSMETEPNVSNKESSSLEPRVNKIESTETTAARQLVELGWGVQANSDSDTSGSVNKENYHFLDAPDVVRLSRNTIDLQRKKSADETSNRGSSLSRHDYALKKDIQAKFDEFLNEQRDFTQNFWLKNYYENEDSDSNQSDFEIPFADFCDTQRERIKRRDKLERHKMLKEEAEKVYPLIDFSKYEKPKEEVNKLTESVDQSKKVEEVQQVLIEAANSSGAPEDDLSSERLNRPRRSAAMRNAAKPSDDVSGAAATNASDVPKPESSMELDIAAGPVTSGITKNEAIEASADVNGTNLAPQDSQTAPTDDLKPKSSRAAKRAAAKAEPTTDPTTEVAEVEEDRRIPFTAVEEWGNVFGYSASGEEIAVIELKPVVRLPPYFQFLRTPVNVRVPDATELQNCPYLGDELGAKDKKFLDDLIYNFEGKLRAWGEIEDIPPHLFVEITQMVWESMGVNIKAPELNIRDPPITVFKKLGKMFKSDDYIKLKERYVNFSSDKNEIKNLRDLTDTTKVFTREESLKTFAKFFCRRCYRYDCEMHDSIPLPKPMKALSDLPKNNIELCKENCYMEYHKCIYFIVSAELGNQWTKRYESEEPMWSNHELTLLNLIKDGHGKNICNIASCFPRKKCVNVFNQLLKDGSLSRLNFKDTKPKFEMSASAEVANRYEVAPGVYVTKRDQTSRGMEATMDSVMKVLAKQQNLPKMPYYQTCQHEQFQDGRPLLCGMTTESCVCVGKSSFCDKSCNCHPDCPNRFPGCRCKGPCTNKSQCLCLMAARECDPDLCKNCCTTTGSVFTERNSLPISHELKHDEDVISALEKDDTEDKLIRREYLRRNGMRQCENNYMQRPFDSSKIVVGVSSVSGWGLFATFAIRQGEFIGEYRGEVVSQNEAERRGKMYDLIFNSYLFNLNSEFVVDATNMGSKMRFINHSAKRANCTARVVQVCGDHRIGVYSLRPIRPGEELFYNYRYSGRKGVNGRKDDSADEDDSESEDEDEDAADEESIYSDHSANDDTEDDGNKAAGKTFSLSGSDNELGDYTYDY